MSETPGSKPVQLSENSGAVVGAPPESEATKAQREADRLAASRSAAAAQPQDDEKPQIEAMPATPGDDQYLDGTWHDHKNYKCPNCHVAFLDIQGGSNAVRSHMRSAHPGVKTNA